MFQRALRCWGFLGSCSLLIAILLSPQTVKAQRQEKDWTATGQRIVELVSEHFYDRKRAAAWTAANAHYPDRAESLEAFVALTRKALAELQASHTAFYTPLHPEYSGLLAIFAEFLGVKNVEYEGIGADFSPEHFVQVLFAGGPAAQAGLRRGDKVLKVDGKDFDPVLSFRGRTGQAVALTVQRRTDEHPVELRATPRKANPKREWLEAQQSGARLIRQEGKVVAYMPLFACAGEEYEAALQDAISDLFRDADALIIDFRYGWGGCNPSFVDLFNKTPQVLIRVGPDGKQTRLDGKWHKPFYLLINAGSRSGKEMVAFAVQKHKLGTLVGQRTAGAVLSGRCFLLPDQSLLYLAVEDALVDGERLEGRGVKPDVEVADTLTFANGADPQLEKAIELVTRSTRRGA